MTSYKRLIPCMFLYNGNAVKWMNDLEVISEEPVELATFYSDHGADELLVFDLTDDEEEKAKTFHLLHEINQAIHMPLVAGGHVDSIEDVDAIIEAGAKRVIFNLSKPESSDLMLAASEKYNKEKLAVSMDDFDKLFKHRKLVNSTTSEIIFMHRLDLNSIANVTEVPCVILTDTLEEEEIFKILNGNGVKGVSGKFISQTMIDINKFKKTCEDKDIPMTSFESKMDFSQFKLNDQGLIPVIVQHYKTNEILMMAYMNEEAFNYTVKSGRMTYFSRSRQKLWIKGETSGHYQFVKSLTVDCDLDTLLAKVDQVGAACHTGNPTCFFQPLLGTEYHDDEGKEVFEKMYKDIIAQKETGRTDNYVNYLFDKGTDKILQKVGSNITSLLIASKNPSRDEIKYEIADFFYHLMILMVEKDIEWEDIIGEIKKKYKK